MTQQFLTAGPAAGTAVSNANTGGTQTTTGGNLAWENDSYTGRTRLRLNYTSNAGALSVRFNLTDQTKTHIAFTEKFVAPSSAPSAEMQVLSIRHSAGKCFSLAWETTGELRFLDSANAASTVAAAGTLTAGSEYVAAIVADGGTGSTDSATVHIYPVGSGTAAATANPTGKNFTTNPFFAFDLGGGTISSGSFAVMDVQVSTGSSTQTEIADYVATAPLSTPVVTLGATTAPTTVGGTNGSQVVTWAAVAGATSYEAWVTKNDANDPNPLQGDFTLVATGVTSPYTFTGLNPAQYDYGIKAKA